MQKKSKKSSLTESTPSVIIANRPYPVSKPGLQSRAKTGTNVPC